MRNNILNLPHYALYVVYTLIPDISDLGLVYIRLRVYFWLDSSVESSWHNSIEYIE